MPISLPGWRQQSSIDSMVSSLHTPSHSINTISSGFAAASLSGSINSNHQEHRNVDNLIKEEDHVSTTTMKVKISHQRWDVMKSNDDLACIIDCTSGRSLARLFNGDGALVAQVEKRRMLSNSYQLSLKIKNSSALKRVTMCPQPSPGVLACFQLKLKFATGNDSLFRWVCISPTEWNLLYHHPGSKRHDLLISHFNTLSPEEGSLDFFHLDCPSHASVFTLAIAFLTSCHINLLDALSLTNSSANVI